MRQALIGAAIKRNRPLRCHLMSWIDATQAPTALEAALAHRPELLARYRAFYGSFWADGLVPRRVLELCRLRVAAMHDCEAEWLLRDAEVNLDADEQERLRAGEVEGFTGPERAALALAEQIPYGHHQVTDAQVELATAAFGEPACVSLLTALAFFDVTCRLRLVLDLPAEPGVLDAPPLSNGALA